MKENQTDTFTPPHCPNPRCNCHTPQESGETWYIRHGKKLHSAKDENATEQFICKNCKRSFSESTFRIDYYEKVRISYEKIVKEIKTDITLTALSTIFETTPQTLKLRLRKICWHLIEKLEQSRNQRLQKKVGKLIYRFHTGEQGYPLIRDLILFLKPLFRIKEKYPGCFFIRSRNPSKEGGIGEGRKRRVTLILWRIIGVWRYLLAGNCCYTPVYLAERLANSFG